MKKIQFHIVYVIMVTLLAIYFLWLFIPKSCTTQPNEVQYKAKYSLLIDSIETAHINNLNKHSDSLISKFKDSIAKIEVEKANLKANYYALRKTVKQLQSVRVDSLSQTVQVPVIVYNASINSGDLCDSLIMYMDAELAIKDSIISTREIQLNACKKLLELKELSNQDLLILIEQLKKEFLKCKNQNKALKIVALITTLANFTH